MPSEVVSSTLRVQPGSERSALDRGQPIPAVLGHDKRSFSRSPTCSAEPFKTLSQFLTSTLAKVQQPWPVPRTVPVVDKRMTPPRQRFCHDPLEVRRTAIKNRRGENEDVVFDPSALK